MGRDLFKKCELERLAEKYARLGQRSMQTR